MPQPNTADRIGAGEYEEDTWQPMQICDLEFKYGKPCSSCIMTTVDPFHPQAKRSSCRRRRAAGNSSANGEPLVTLGRTRSRPLHGAGSASCVSLGRMISRRVARPVQG